MNKPTINYMTILQAIAGTHFLSKDRKAVKLFARDADIRIPEIQERLKSVANGASIQVDEILYHTLGFVDAILWMEENGYINHKAVRNDDVKGVSYMDMAMISQIAGGMTKAGRPVEELIREASKLK